MGCSKPRPTRSSAVTPSNASGLTKPNATKRSATSNSIPTDVRASAALVFLSSKPTCLTTTLPISNFQPSSLEVRRALMPLRPIATDKSSSTTSKYILRLSLSKFTFWGTAGFSASANCSIGSSYQRTISTFSPFISRTILFTREPLAPTQAPTGSTLGSVLLTHTFVRYPGSRAMAANETVPSAISATSISKSLRTKLRLERLRMSSGPLPCCSSLCNKQRILSPGTQSSPGTLSRHGRRASALPTSTTKSPLSFRRTIPVTKPPTWSRNSS